MTRAALARRIGQSESAIRRLLASGGNPTLKTMLELADELGLVVTLVPRPNFSAATSIHGVAARRLRRRPGWPLPFGGPPPEARLRAAVDADTVENEAHPHATDRAPRVRRTSLEDEEPGPCPGPRPLRGGAENNHAKGALSQDRPRQMPQVRRSAGNLWLSCPPLERGVQARPQCASRACVSDVLVVELTEWRVSNIDGWSF